MMLVYTLIEAYSKTIMAGVHATGKIRLYQIVIGSFQIAILPIAYILLRAGFTPTVVLVALIVIDVLALFARMLMAHSIFNLSIWEFFKSVLLNSLIVTMLAVILPYLLKECMAECLLRFIIVILLSMICTSITILYVGCSQNERKAIFAKAKSMAKRFTK